MENQTTEIIICGACNGDGTKQNQEIDDYHRCEYTYWTTVCESCNGSGRLLKTITVTTAAYSDSTTGDLIEE